VPRYPVTRPVFRSHSPFVPDAVADSQSGLRRSMQRIKDLVDTSDPAWPSIAAVLREFANAGIDLNEASVSMAVKLGRQRWAPLDEAKLSAPSQAPLAAGSGSVVYYVRRARLIKIGTTTNPRDRFSNLLPDEILAVEPGDRRREQMRHVQFGHLRVTGEYFGDEPELRDHIAALVALYGPPDPSWPTIATPPPVAWRPSMPSTSQTLTAAEAWFELRINRVTICAWVRAGRIDIAGINKNRARTYNREQLIALRDSPRERMRGGV